MLKLSRFGENLCQAMQAARCTCRIQDHATSKVFSIMSMSLPLQRPRDVIALHMCPSWSRGRREYTHSFYATCANSEKQHPVFTDIPGATPIASSPGILPLDTFKTSSANTAFAQEDIICLDCTLHFWLDRFPIYFTRIRPSQHLSPNRVTTADFRGRPYDPIACSQTYQRI